MNERSKSDLLFDEDDEFLDALEEALRDPGEGDAGMKAPTYGKCNNFINANCSFHCPNAALEAACDRWGLDPSDFGMERTDCKDCYMNDDCCTCDDCYVQFDPKYCPKKKK